MEYPPTVILRHRKENLKKCSLRGLEERSDMQFFQYPKQDLPPLPGYIILDLDAPPLSQEDGDRGLFLLDGTWRYAERMAKVVPAEGMLSRSIPGEVRTAYPRKQEDCQDPERGLASVEALYVAYLMLGRPVEGLLDRYHWKEEFLELNKQVLAPYE